MASLPLARRISEALAVALQTGLVGLAMKSLFRLIARLDIKGPNVIKGVRMEGLRVVGKPKDLAQKYAWEAHELLYIDTVASLYGRNHLRELLEETSERVFLPLTAGGGVKSVEDGIALLRSGADKITLNTAAVKRPELVGELAAYLGSQAVVVSIEAKRTAIGWEAYTDGGRQKTGKDAVRWAQEANDLGAGEILLTSVDRDGTYQGFDLKLIEAVSPKVRCCVIASGGCGSVDHIRQARDAGADAVAIASALHYDRPSLKEIKSEFVERELPAQGRSEERRAA